MDRGTHTARILFPMKQALDTYCSFFSSHKEPSLMDRLWVRFAKHNIACIEQNGAPRMQKRCEQGKKQLDQASPSEKGLFLSHIFFLSASMMQPSRFSRHHLFFFRGINSLEHEYLFIKLIFFFSPLTVTCRKSIYN